MRTEADDAEFFGSDAAEWLRRWDEGRSVWTIEMGGLGPGYEQCIHVTCAEILRHVLGAEYKKDALQDKEQWPAIRDKIEEASHSNETIKKLGLSGAQYGAAMNIAMQLYMRGPAEIMRDERVKDRHIQVSKGFPV